MDLSCFKAYDLRGRVPDQLNPVLAEKIGRAYVEITGAKKVIVGYDIRLSSPDIAEALSSGRLGGGTAMMPCIPLLISARTRTEPS